MKKGYLETHPLAKAGIFAFPLLIFMLIMESLYPTIAPDGYKSFIIAFEFAKTPEQIHELLQPLTTELIKKIETGNYFDFGFMLSYFFFLIFFIRDAAKAFSKKWLLIGIPLALVILFADVYENILLFDITGSYSPTINDADLNTILNILHKVTWIKWGGLSLIFILFSINFLERRLQTKIEGLVCIFPFMMGVFAIFNNSVIITWFTVSVFLVFFVLIMLAFTYNEDLSKDPE